MSESFEAKAVKAIQSAGLCESCPYGQKLLTSSRDQDERPSKHNMLAYDSAILTTLTKLSEIEPCEGAKPFVLSPEFIAAHAVAALIFDSTENYTCGLEKRNHQRVHQELKDEGIIL